MTKVLVGICFLFAALTTSTIATETVVFDGPWWQSLSYPEQIRAVQGMLSGFQAGYFTAKLIVHDQMMHVPGGSGPGAASKVSTLVDVQTNLQSRTPAIGSGMTFGTIADRLSAVYRDHPRMAKEEVAWFISCAAIASDNCESVVSRLGNK